MRRGRALRGGFPGGIRAGAALGAALLIGCARFSVRDEDLARLERGELTPAEALITCHGMLFDLGFPWDYRLRDDAARKGRLGIVVTYWVGPLGVVFNWGAGATGRLIANLADGLERLHRETGCAAPLRLEAAGFSAGSEALLDAAFRFEVARFHRVVLLNPSCFAFSGEPRRLVDAGRIAALTCFWSPLDLVTLLAPLGAGELAVHPAGPGIENRIHWNTHLPPLFESGRRRVLDVLLEPVSGAPVHTCSSDAAYRRRVADLLRSARSKNR